MKFLIRASIERPGMRPTKNTSSIISGSASAYFSRYVLYRLISTVHLALSFSVWVIHSHLPPLFQSFGGQLAVAIFCDRLLFTILHDLARFAGSFVDTLSYYTAHNVTRVRTMRFGIKKRTRRSHSRLPTISNRYNTTNNIENDRDDKQDDDRDDQKRGLSITSLVSDCPGHRHHHRHH